MLTKPGPITTRLGAYGPSSTGIPTFSFSAGATTFTAGMAKRSGSLFAAAPLVQGPYADGLEVGDSLTYSRGNQISGNWYETLDPFQGTISFFWTPEFDPGVVGQDTFLWTSETTQFFFRINSNGRPRFVTEGISFSAAGSFTWTPGTTYHICVSWDVLHTIDGTNYCRISVNDTHQYGDNTVTGSSRTPASSIAIGSRQAGTDTGSANGIIEGFTIYRRVLFDGTYGIDVGNGDEIALIYNSGSFKDPCEITGSWDVVFCLPTNSSTGELVTGTGEAWSHPHSSNLLTAADGFAITTYGSSNWNDEGTPSASGDITASERIANWGYEWTNDAANEGIYIDYTVVANQDYVIRALAHSDGTSVPKVIAYDQTGGAEIGSMTGSTGSTRTAPDVFIFTIKIPTGCTTLRLKVVSTATSGVTYFHQMELLGNEVNNPSMASGSGDPWVPDEWSNQGVDAGEASQETTIVHSGSNSLKINSGWANNGTEVYNPTGKSTGVADRFVSCGMFSYAGGGGDGSQLRSSNLYKQTTLSTEFDYTGPSGASWSLVPTVGRVRTVTASGAVALAGGGTAPVYVDDVYQFLLDDVSLTVTPANETNSTENGGIRVEGHDDATASTSGPTISQGAIEVYVTPRRSLANQADFAQGNSVMWAWYYDTQNRIEIQYLSATSIRAQARFNNTLITATWSSASFDANVRYLTRVEYTSGGDLVLKIDGEEKASASGVVDFANLPTTIYLHDEDGLAHWDAIYGASS